MEINSTQGVNPMVNRYQSNPMDNTQKEQNKINPNQKDETKPQNVDPNKGNNVDIEV